MTLNPVAPEAFGMLFCVKGSTEANAIVASLFAKVVEMSSGLPLKMLSNDLAPKTGSLLSTLSQIPM